MIKYPFRLIEVEANPAFSKTCRCVVPAVLASLNREHVYDGPLWPVFSVRKVFERSTDRTFYVDGFGNGFGGFHMTSSGELRYSLLGNYIYVKEVPMESVSVLESHLGYWLRMVSNQVSFSFARRLRSHGVTVAEWVLMRHLFRQTDAQAVALADATGLTRGAVSKLVDRLETKRLLNRKNSKEDLRREKLNLTSEGARLVPILARLADKNDRAFFVSLKPEERAHLLALLQAVAQANCITSAPTD